MSFYLSPGKLSSRSLYCCTISGKTFLTKSLLSYLG